MQKHDKQIYFLSVLVVLIAWAIGSLTKTEALLLIIAQTAIQIFIMLCRIYGKLN